MYPSPSRDTLTTRRRVKLARRLSVFALATMGAVPCLAVPLSADDADDQARASAASAAWASSAPSPVEAPELEVLVEREVEAQALHGHVERERGALLQQPYEPRAPTWIQSAVTVNIGDHPKLDREAEQGERELETTLWLIEDSARRAARAARAAGSAPPDDAPEPWLRALLRAVVPAQLISTIKAHREGVTAGAVALLILAGLYTAMASRRDLAGAVRRRRRRRRIRKSSSLHDVVRASLSTRTRRRRRRHRRTHGEPSTASGASNTD